jgi:hypothetical protein
VETQALLDAFRQLAPAGARVQSHSSHYISMFCAMVALFGGTDFTRPMPQVGPRRVWDSLSVVYPTLLRSFDTELAQLDPAVAAEDLVGAVYAQVYSSHVGLSRGLTSVLASLCGPHSKLASTTKARLPSPRFVDASVRNVNWVLQYWAGGAPDELAGNFGFAESPTRPGSIVFADTVA